MEHSDSKTTLVEASAIFMVSISIRAVLLTIVAALFYRFHSFCEKLFDGVPPAQALLSVIDILLFVAFIGFVMVVSSVHLKNDGKKQLLRFLWIRK